MRPPGPGRLVRLAFLFYGLLLAVAVGWRVGIHGENLFFAPGSFSTGAPLRDLGVGVLAAAVVVALSFALTRTTRIGEALARSLARVLGPLQGRHCVMLALASGIGEEAFFRGALQPRVGLLVASLVFALAHFVPRRDLAPWSLFSFLAGLLLGGLFEVTGNLLAPTVAHVAINAINLRLLVKEFGPRP
jgi:membrane protease YdiL (CAAX protease family)